MCNGMLLGYVGTLDVKAAAFPTMVMTHRAELSSGRIQLIHVLGDKDRGLHAIWHF